MSYNNEKVVLSPEDQFEIKHRDHMESMINIFNDLTDRLMIPIKLDEYLLEKFVKEHSSGYDKMRNKYDDYLEELEEEQKYERERGW